LAEEKPVEPDFEETDMNCPECGGELYIVNGEDVYMCPYCEELMCKDCFEEV